MLLLFFIMIKENEKKIVDKICQQNRFSYSEANKKGTIVVT